MALAGDNPEEAYLWLLNQGYQDFAMVANRIRQVKNEIDEINLDLHLMLGGIRYERLRRGSRFNFGAYVSGYNGGFVQNVQESKIKDSQ